MLNKKYNEITVEQMVEYMIQNIGDSVSTFQKSLDLCKSNKVYSVEDLCATSDVFRKSTLLFDQRLEAYFKFANVSKQKAQ